MNNELPKSGMTIFLDSLRHLLILSATGYLVFLIWKWNLIVAIIAAFPIYIIMLNFFGFLTLPLYALTPENKQKANAFKSILDGDSKTGGALSNESETAKNAPASLLQAITQISDLSYEPLVTKYSFFNNCLKKYKNPKAELTLWMTAAGAGYVLATKEGYPGEHDEIIKLVGQVPSLSGFVKDFADIMAKVKDDEKQRAMALPMWVLFHLKGENPTMEELKGPGVDIAKILDLTIREYEEEQAKAIKG